MTYHVEISSIRWSSTGIVHTWMPATPHVYKRRSAAARLAGELKSATYATRVVAKAEASS